MAQQSSRLQRLLTLLDTGSTQATRLTATRQIGDIVKSHPHDLNSLLKKEYDIGSDNENNPKERLARQKQNLRCYLGKITSISRAGYDQRARNQHLQLPFEQWSSSKLSQGPMIQNHCYLSTMTTNDTSEEGSEQKTISVTFVDKDGEENNIEVPIGMSMLEAAHENDIELEGACEGSLACSTCHVIVMDVDYYNKLEDPTDEENDMLDLAFGLTETSRLGCQVIAKPELDGIRLAIPAATRNFAVDGYVPKPH